MNKKAIIMNPYLLLGAIIGFLLLSVSFSASKLPIKNDNGDDCTKNMSCTPKNSSLTSYEQEVLEEMRKQHYPGYPESWSGYVERESGDSTSETMGMMALVECSHGNIDNCKKILTWADAHAWQPGDYTFAWHFTDTEIKDQESATDGDLMLIWSAVRGYMRSNDQELLTLYNKWKPNIQRLDTCTISGNKYVASGSGIGRWNGCNSYNGVYAAYLMPGLLYDLKEYDHSWSPIFDGSMKQTYEMFRQGGKFPGRCAAFDGNNFDFSKCELNPNYFDVFDAQRIMFWTGLACKKGISHPACDNLKMIVNTYVASDFGTAEGGYEMSGQARGNIQFNEFNAALWSTAIDYTNGKGNQLIQNIQSKWNGHDYAGTQCHFLAIIPSDCVDTFKDLHILISTIEENHGI